MVRDYELMYIIRPELDDEAVQASIDSVGKLIETNGGEVVKVTPWGKRRLAFEVNHIRDGYYVLSKLKLEGGKVTDVERTLRISDTVFRHLLVLDEGTPDDESGVPGRPSREPRREGAAAHAPRAGVPADDAADADAADTDAADAPEVDAEDDDPVLPEPVAVAAGTQIAVTPDEGDGAHEEEN